MPIAGELAASLEHAKLAALHLMAASGHAGAAINPAVLATAAVYSCKAERILPAIVLGDEVAVRAAAARDFPALTTLVSGPWSGFVVR